MRRFGKKKEKDRVNETRMAIPNSGKGSQEEKEVFAFLIAIPSKKDEAAPKVPFPERLRRLSLIHNFKNLLKSSKSCTSTFPSQTNLSRCRIM